MSKLTLFIDGKKTNLLQPLLTKLRPNRPQKVYWAPSPQASIYGLQVDGSVLPNGLGTVFTIGMVDDDGNVDGSPVTIPLVADADSRSKVRGEVTITVPGHGEKQAEVMVNDLGDGRFTIKASVHGKSGGSARKAATANDIFA